jgi:hypothetical protein
MTREGDTNLLDIDTMAGAAEYQACPHGFGITFGLLDTLLVDHTLTVLK